MDVSPPVLEREFPVRRVRRRSLDQERPRAGGVRHGERGRWCQHEGRERPLVVEEESSSPLQCSGIYQGAPLFFSY
jgi:hypothetical protein